MFINISNTNELSSIKDYWELNFKSLWATDDFFHWLVGVLDQTLDLEQLGING